MGVDTWIGICANIMAILIAAIGGIVWVNTQISERKNETNLVRQDLENHKKHHVDLKERLEKHEGKMDEKLNTMNEKLDDLKDLIINLKK